MTTWQPIETVPKDGTHILLWPFTDFGESMVVVGIRTHDGWFEDVVEGYGFDTATHWMPLPDPPKESP